ncbi:MAG: hypothetical protein NZ580_05480 [Bacteroidia bacterium]|nr:hypothetical protein [Bacteroidia bacterium]MDW8236327.1 hypothetical protein [Bacteroidia bacterium]
MSSVSLFLLGLGAAVGVWLGGASYHAYIMERGEWDIVGLGGVVRHPELEQIRRRMTGSLESWLWAVRQQLLNEIGARKVEVTFKAQGGGTIQIEMRKPVARAVLPLRHFYIDGEGYRFLPLRNLDLPLVEMPRWDSVAVFTFLRWWETQPWYHRAVSCLRQDAEGIWHGYLEVAPERFVLGRTEDLPVALRHWETYLKVLQPRIGAQRCSAVLLYVPGQIICQ